MSGQISNEDVLGGRYQEFIDAQVSAIKEAVGSEKAITALSGGVDSSAVTVLGYRALGDQLSVVYVETGLMREGEQDEVVSTFAGVGIEVHVIDAADKFFTALKGLEDPEEKRKAIRSTFYADVFVEYVRQIGATEVLQGTNRTDIEETERGVKTQHNILEQMGIDPRGEFGYGVVEPIKTLRKDGIRIVAQALGLPETVYNRIPFPGPALAARIIGEVTPERVAVVRAATAIVEEEISVSYPDAFQYLAVLMNDKATGMTADGRRDFGQIIAVRSIQSVDARTATPTELSWETFRTLEKRITSDVPGVARVLYDITGKPPACVEYI